MATFKTEYHGVSHGPAEFFAADGVIEIPDEYVPAFTAMIASGELVAVEAAPAEGDAKSLDADAPKGEVKPDEPKGDAEEPKKKGKKE